MKKNIYVVIALILTGILGMIVWSFNHKDADRGPQIPEPLDITLDFYNEWLQAVKSTSTNPYDAKLTEHSTLSTEMKSILASKGINTTPDPVLCSPVVPERIGAKVIYELATSSQMMVVPRSTASSTGSAAIVDLVRTDTSWTIVNITCSTGESAPESEFSFEKTGHLLKDNVPAPLNKEFWHLVYSENGTDGYTAPLFFSTTSICMTGETTAPCATTFVEAEEVQVFGHMTEAGVDVTRLVSIKKPE